MHWLQPLAWWGLASVAIPILIHLLARHRWPRLPFPSLKFLRAGQAAARRRRALSDWPLLVMRVLIVAMAVAALAGPVFVSTARRAAWNQRVARAIVVPTEDREAVASMVAGELRSGFAAARFSSPVLADALTEAVDWLRLQPPAAREVVFAGDFREGALSERDLDAVPPYAGIRFLPVPRTAAPPQQPFAAVADGPGGLASYRVHFELEPLRTHVRHDLDPRDRAPRVRLVADPPTQSYADALLRAVLRSGTWLENHGDRRVTLAFRGAAGVAGIREPTTPWIQQALAATPEAAGGEVDGALIGVVDMPATDPRAPDLVAGLLRAVFAETFDALEPRRIAPATLARWSRPAGAVPADIEPADEGDRRWFWGAAILLLAVEQLVRARRRSANAGDGAVGEKRVA